MKGRLFVDQKGITYWAPDGKKQANFTDDRALLKKALTEKSLEEDNALKEKAVTYTQFSELKDLADDHLIRTDQKAFFEGRLNQMISDPEEWHL